MHLIINNSSMQPIYEQITDQIKGMIIDGTLREEEIEVVKLFYGFDQDAKSYKEIEQILNIKPRRINHLLEKSKKKLRKKLLIDSTGRTKNNK